MMKKWMLWLVASFIGVVVVQLLWWIYQMYIQRKSAEHHDTYSIIEEAEHIKPTPTTDYHTNDNIPVKTDQPIA